MKIFISFVVLILFLSSCGKMESNKEYNDIQSDLHEVEIEIIE